MDRQYWRIGLTWLTVICVLIAIQAHAIGFPPPVQLTDTPQDEREPVCASPYNTQILFVAPSSTTGADEIFLIPFDGTEATQITSDGQDHGGYRDPQWRRTGSMCSYLTAEGTVIGNPLDGNSPSELKHPFDRWITHHGWNATGTAFAYVIRTPLGETPINTQLMLSSSSEAVYTLVSESATISEVAWYTYTNTALYQSQIAFRSTQSGNSDIWVVNPDGSDLFQLTRDSGEDIEPAWSPDGERIAFVSDRSGNRDIWVMGRNDVAPVQVTTDAAEDRHPSWARNGNLVFSSNRSGNFDLWAVDVSDLWSPVIAVTDTDIEATDPDWSPDGSQIAFSSWVDLPNYTNKIGIVVIGEEPDELPGIWTYAVPEPRWVLGTSEVILRYQFEPPYGATQKLRSAVPDDFYDRWNLSTPHYTVPDDEVLYGYAVSRMDGRIAIAVSAADEYTLGTLGPQTQIHTSAVPILNPVWAPDGQSIMFDTDDGTVLWTINSDGTDLRQISPGNLTEVRIWCPAFSSDGQMLAFTDQRDIWVMPLIDGAEAVRCTSEADQSYSSGNGIGDLAWSPSPTDATIAFSWYRRKDDGVSNRDIYSVDVSGILQTLETAQQARGLLDEATEYKQYFHQGTASISYADVRPDSTSENRFDSQKAHEALTKFGTALDSRPSYRTAQTGLLDAIYEISVVHALTANDELVNAFEQRYVSLSSLLDEIAFINQALVSCNSATSIVHQGLLNRASVFEMNEPQRDYSEYRAHVTASALKSLGYYELGNRLFRLHMNKPLRSETSTNSRVELVAPSVRKGALAAYLEAAMAAYLLEDAYPDGLDQAEDRTGAEYQQLLSNLAAMSDVHRNLMKGLSPLGYTETHVPGPLTTAPPEEVNNTTYYLQNFLTVLGDLEGAEGTVTAHQREFEQNSTQFGQTLLANRDKYGTELANTELEMESVLSQIKTAGLRLDQVVQQMADVYERIRIEQRRIAKQAGVAEAIAQVQLQSGEQFGALARAEARIEQQERRNRMFGNFFNPLINGLVNPADAWGFVRNWTSLVIDMATVDRDLGLIRDRTELQVRRAQLQATTEAKLTYLGLKGQQVDSLALIQTSLLDLNTLDIEAEIATENISQAMETYSLLLKRHEQIEANKQEAERLLAGSYFTDPSVRLFRDEARLEVEYQFDRASDYAFQTIKAMEYQWNTTYSDYLYRVYTAMGHSDLYRIYNELWDRNNLLIAGPKPNYAEDRPAISIREDLLGFAPEGEVPDETGLTPFQQFLKQHRGYDDNISRHYLKFTFSTSPALDDDQDSGNDLFTRQFPLRWNDKIEYLKMNITGDLYIPVSQISVYLTQRGTTWLKNSEGAFVEFNMEPATTELIAGVNAWDPATLDDNRQLYDRSVYCATWQFLLYGTQDFPVEDDDFLTQIHDIELYARHGGYSLPAPVQPEQQEP